MTAVIISNTPPYRFGQQSNQVVSKLIGLNTQLLRLAEAIATASSGFTGTPGTEFEATGFGPSASNLFGVQPSATEGEQGSAYKYAMESLVNAWKPFWDAAAPFVEAIDNGNVSM